MAKRRKGITNNEKAAWLGIVGGILMIIAGVTGAATWNSIGDQAVSITGNQDLATAFQALVLLGSLGGFLVIIGCLFIGWKIVKMDRKKRVKLGKFFVSIGAGFGLFGLLIIGILILLGDDPMGNFIGAMGIGFIGLMLTVMARQRTN